SANEARLRPPGRFARIRLPVGAPYQALLISEQALGTDQGQKFVFVANEKNEIAYRRVKIGRAHDGMRVVTDGLKMGERIVVNGLQRVQHGAKVDPKEIPMPTATIRNQDSGVKKQPAN